MQRTASSLSLRTAYFTRTSSYDFIYEGVIQTSGHIYFSMVISFYPATYTVQAFVNGAKIVDSLGSVVGAGHLPLQKFTITKACTLKITADA